MFSSLRVANFRTFVLSQFTSTTSIWMQRIAQDWLVLELSGSVTAVGLLVMVQFGPWVVLGPFSGVLVDRYNKRTVMMIAQSVTGVAGLVMASLAFTGNLEIWHVFALAGLVGTMSVVEQPARLVFVGEIVEPSVLSNAASMNQAIFQISAMIGPTVSGVLISTVGTPWPFAVTGFGHAVSVLLLCRIDRSTLVEMPKLPRSRGQLLEPFRFIRNTPMVRWIFGLVFAYSLCAHTWPVLLAPMADTVFATGASGYGIYNAAIAGGALLGAFLAMRRLTLQMRNLVLTMIGATFFKASSAFAPTEWIFITLIGISGVFMVMMWSAANPLLQLSSNLEMRGRLMALFLMIVNGGEAAGAPLLGWVADRWGAQNAIFVSGALPFTVAVIAAAVLAKQGGHLAGRKGEPS